MRICIVEDNKPLLENLRLLLEGEPSFSVVGAYPSAEAALREKPWQNADMLLVDIDLPGLSGVDLIRRVHPEVPRLHILVYTISENRDTVFAALKAGAMGYLLKGCPPRELIDSLRSLHHGGAPMSPKIARKVILELQLPEASPGIEFLSSREKEVLTAIAAGKSYKEMAQSFGISPHTIHAHIKKAYEKLQAATRGEALQKARDMGVI
ncbi:MAG: response regulator transcription factor [Verrucomicrobiota bacterium]